MFGWASSCVSDDLKTRAFASVLDQDAEFYDRTPGACVIQRIQTDSMAVKAVWILD